MIERMRRIMLSSAMLKSGIPLLAAWSKVRLKKRTLMKKVIARLLSSLPTTSNVKKKWKSQDMASLRATASRL